MAAGTLEVMQTLQRAGGQLRFLPPKTEDSPRTVPLPDFCLHPLKEHAERQADRHDGAGDKWRDHGLVFPTGVGTPMEPDNLRGSSGRIKKGEGNGHSIPSGNHAAQRPLPAVGCGNRRSVLHGLF